jgi:putative DNA methylase
MTNIHKRLIEVSLPLQAISEQSAREKFIRHGHISTLHIWWARRPLAAMRAAIFAALMPAPESDEERKELEDLVATIVDWDQVKDGNSPAIERAKALIREAYPDHPPKLLDPFMGGGATGLEALRLGCETHAVELNPVAHLIELCTLVYPQKYGQPGASQSLKSEQPKQARLPGQEEPEQMTMDLPAAEGERNQLAADVQYWGEWVLERAREEIGCLYENPEGDETIVGYLWARTVTCPNPNCGAEMPMVRQWWLAKRKGRRIALKPVVDQGTKQISFKVVDMQQRDVGDFNPSEGTNKRGHTTCLVCGQTADVQYVRDEGQAGRMGEMPLAVITEKEGRGKGYRAFNIDDRNLYQKVLALLPDAAGDLPDEDIPLTELRRISVPIYGLDAWRKLFNPRQSLALVTLSSKIQKAHSEITKMTEDMEYAKAVITYLALALDRLANQGSNLARWNSSGEKIEGVFSRQAIGMIWDYVEVNPFSGATGDWSGALDWITRVIEHTSEAADKPAIVQQGTATRMSLPNSYADAIITDPPYYDSVPYSHLADFFYVWLKRTIGQWYPGVFRTPLTPKGPEIVQDRPHSLSSSTKDAEFYEHEMTRAFVDARRVLQPDGIAVIVFAHKSLSAWETLLNSLLDAELVVTASWPLHTEMSTRIRAQGTASLASSIFIVCRVRAAEKAGYFDDVREALATTIKERLDFFWAQGIRGADFFISAIGPAVAVFGQYSQVTRLDGEAVGVGDLLDLVQSMVADYALNRILNTSAGRGTGSGAASQIGTVDPITRYYILHRWAYGDERIRFDDAMRLAMGLGADVTALMDRDVLKQYGDQVRLQGPKQRKAKALGEPDRTGLAAPTIDVVHRAVVLWERGDRDALAQFLAKAASDREEKVRLVAQTLINILPDGDSERRLLEGFLAGRDLLPEVERQERLF